MTLITVSPIKTETDYEVALERVTQLMDAPSDTPESDELDILTTLIEAYENEHYPMDFPDPLTALRFRMEQAGLTPDDLVPYLGSHATALEILSGKCPLSLSMIRALHRHLQIPAEILLQA